MPVLLDEKDYEPWLRSKSGLELLKPPQETCRRNGRYQSV